MRPTAVIGAVLLTSLAACQAGADRPATGGGPTGLAGTTWQLVEIRAKDEAQGSLRPDDPAKYTLAFGGDGRVAVGLDCNRGAGPWQAGPVDAAGGSLTIGPLATTRAFCPPPSLGTKLAANLGDVRSYSLRDGQLALGLMADAGILLWKPAGP